MAILIAASFETFGVFLLILILVVFSISANQALFLRTKLQHIIIIAKFSGEKKW